jgi:hypothetical protein
VVTASSDEDVTKGWQMKKLMLVGVVAGMMALNAPVAHAAVVRSGCGFDSVAQETVTGGQDTFTGGAYGYAIFDDQGTHTLRCYVTVDGAEQATTPTQSGTAFVATTGQVTYNAPEGATVDLCTEIDGATVSCGPATDSQIPPQEVVDLVDQIIGVVDVFGPTIDFLVCPIFVALAGTYAVTTPFGNVTLLYIAPDGDVYPGGVGPAWICPPY